MSTYAWQRFYEAAVLETDRSKLPALLEKVELAIESRLSELSPMDSSEERRLIASAQRGLAALRWEMDADSAQAAAN